MTLTALRCNNRADDPDCSEWGNRADDPVCSEGPTFEKPVLAPLAGVQLRWSQGFQRGDGFSDQETTAYLNVN